MRKSTPAQQPAVQLTVMQPNHPVIEALKTLDVEALSPLEAITKLFELRRQANEG